jgi:hypothetical protein
MNASKPTKAAYFDYIGSIELPLDVIDACGHGGDCTNDVEECMTLPEVKAELSEIEPEQLRKELKEYGAWDEEQLADHQENLKRILWLAASGIKDGQFDELEG